MIGTGVIEVAETGNCKVTVHVVDDELERFAELSHGEFMEIRDTLKCDS